MEEARAAEGGRPFGDPARRSVSRARPRPPARSRHSPGAMARGPLGCTVALGLPALRARIARLYGDWYGVDLDPARVVVTSGSSAGFILAFTALFDAGDRSRSASPAIRAIANILKSLSLEPVGLRPPGKPLPARPGRSRPARSRRAADRQSGQPDRNHARPARARGADRRRRRAWDRLHLRRDSSRDPVWGPAGLGARDQRPVYVINSFSKYFDDRLAHRLDGGAGRACPRRIERLAQNLFICPSHASRSRPRPRSMRPTSSTAIATYRANRALML